MAETSIEWTDRSWNPVRGCRRVSPGCERCYAERQAHRFSGAGQPYEGLTKLTKRGPVWTGEARFVAEMLDAPLRWKKPERIFVNSMSDLFHGDITNEQIAAVFGVMAACPQHTFQILTKRPGRMFDWFRWLGEDELDIAACQAARVLYPEDRGAHLSFEHHVGMGDWPLPNVWLGVSAEDQQRADERIPLLLQCPAAVRFASMEPLLGDIYFTWRLKPANPCVPEAGTHERGLDWVIVGGESGPGARECDLAWVRSIIDQCAEHGVRCFVKQLGARPVVDSGLWAADVGGQGDGKPYVAGRVGPQGTVIRTLGVIDRKGGNPAEWPADLRVRQFPEVTYG